MDETSPPSRKLTPKKIGTTALKIVISGGLFFIVLYNLDLKQIFGQLHSISAGFVLKVALINVVILILKTIRWYLLINVSQRVISYPLVFSIFVRAFFLGLITPGRLGEFIKVKYLSDSVPSYSMSRSLTTVLVDRFMDLLVLLGLSVGGFFLFFSSLTLQVGVSYLHFIILGGVLLGGMLIILFRKPLDQFLLRVPFYYKAKTMIKDFIEGMKYYSPRILLLPILLTLLDTVLIGFQLHFIIIEFQLDSVFSYFQSLVSISFANVVSLVPVTISGFGAREGIYTILLGSVGVAGETAILVSLLTYFTQYLLFFPILLVLFPLHWIIKRRASKHSN
jgi:glycosyltransferase 2 family protein